MNNYFETHRKEDCNNCGVCALRCPVKAIQMVKDSDGFAYPVVDGKKCINCGLCKKNCSNKLEMSGIESVAYMASIKDVDVKKISSSGGIFFSIAKYVLEKKGVVFGVEYDENLKVHHTMIDNIYDLNKIQGSKYVCSDLNNSFIEVEKNLKKGKIVLFSGTPCQCAGLRKYLLKEYENLITCEIICHANPSPKVFEMYIKNLEKLSHKKVKNVLFRSKENGWKNQTTIIEYDDGEKVENDVFHKAFLAQLINKPACNNCKFCSTNRLSDFTIGDFWGYEKIKSNFPDTENGVSILCINTNKGKNIFEKIKIQLNFNRVDKEQAFSFNHHSNSRKNINRKKFFEGIRKGKINEENIIYYMEKYSKLHLYRKIIRKIKHYINIINQNVRNNNQVKH